jgi:hypothetical protein
MKEFGKKLNIKHREQEPGDKEIFLDLVVSLDQCWQRTVYMEEHIGLGIASYEESLYDIIENLVFLHFSKWKAEIMLWWVFDRFDEDGNLLPINFNDNPEQEFEEISIETPEQLWDLFKKIEKK